jgi:hypothetical protein
MSYPVPLYSNNKPCEEAIADLTRQLQAANFQVVRTFDLQAAQIPLAGQGGCTCPNHGTEACDCQVVILLVYSESQRPISLMAHGHQDRTWFELVDTPEQRADSHFREAVRLALLKQIAP